MRHIKTKNLSAQKISLGALLLLYVGFGVYILSVIIATYSELRYSVDFNDEIQRIAPDDVGVVASTYGASPLSQPSQKDSERRLDARHVRIPVGYRDGRVTSSAKGGPTDLDVPALVNLYTSWGYKVLITIGGRTNDVDIQPGDATKIINSLGTGPAISYGAPNEAGNQSKTIQDQINLTRMIVAEGKMIDPGFKIWGPAEAYYDRGNIKTFAAAVGSDLAGISYHHYAMGETSISTEQAMSETPSYGREISEIKADLGSLGLDVPVSVNELNFSWRYNDGTGGGNNRLLSSVNTVWMASALGHILQAGGRGMPYATQNGALGVTVEDGEINPGGRPVSSPTPAYWGIAAWTGAKQWPHYKDAVYATSTDDKSGEIFAVNNEAGGYNIIIINKSETDAKQIALDMRGVSSGDYTVYQTNQAKPYDQPGMIKESTYTAAESIDLSLPKMSVTVIVLAPLD